MALRTQARAAAIRAGALARAARQALTRARGGPGPVEIVAYRGDGCADRLHLKGRVVAARGLSPARADDTLWRNVRNMQRRALARAIPHARLEARFQGRTLELRTDALGYFEAWLRPTAPLPPDARWVEVDLELVAPIHPAQGPVRAVAEVRVPGPAARLVVVTDLDDTVVRTGAASFVSMLRESFTGNAYTRVPFAGVAALYRALVRGRGGDEGNPLLFVSRSPWNLYDVFSDLLRIHGVDERPVIFLRQWGLTEEGLTRADVLGLKYERIRQAMDLHRDLPFLLVGDSGQKDPEIYREVVRRHPGRVLAVYIRDVSDGSRAGVIRALAREVAAQGSTLVLAADSLEMARHAAASGWIDPAAVAAVRGERAVDRDVGHAPTDTRPAREITGRDAGETASEIDAGALDRARRDEAPVVVGRPDRPAPPGGGPAPRPGK